MQPASFLKQSTHELVEQEAWGFIACYDDGTSLHQFDFATNLYHSFPEIDQSRLRTFKMINFATNQKVTILFPPAAQLIYIYRNTVLDHGTDHEIHYRWYGFGYKMSGISCLFLITHENEIIFTDDFDKVDIA